MTQLWFNTSSWLVMCCCYMWLLKPCVPIHTCVIMIMDWVWWQHGGLVVSTVVSQREGASFDSQSGNSVWSLQVLPVSASGLKDAVRVGIKPPTFQLVEDLLYPRCRGRPIQWDRMELFSFSSITLHIWPLQQRSFHFIFKLMRQICLVESPIKMLINTLVLQK